MTPTSMFCGVSLAERIERAEAQLIVAATEAAGARGAWGMVLPVAGGFACCADDGSPMNKVVGLGFGGVPDTAVLDGVEHAFRSHTVAIQVELSNLADPDVGAVLSARGYRLVGFENVLGCALPREAPPDADREVTVRRGGPDDVEAWIDAIVEGFSVPDGDGAASHEEFPRDVIERAERDFEKAGAVPYLATCEGVVAGSASMRCSDGIAQLTGAATVPAYRRRGVQTALLGARLSDAARAGCDIAVVATAPGSGSQRNVQRHGFHLLYTRAVMVKE